jgi:hypothetical protein
MLMLCPMFENLSQNLLIYIDLRNKLVESKGLLIDRVPNGFTCLVYSQLGKEDAYNDNEENFMDTISVTNIIAYFLNVNIKDKDSRKIISIYQEFIVNMLSNLT